MPRIKILRGILFVALAVIVVRLFFIQIVEHESWVAKAEEQHTLLETIVADRGQIYMLDAGEPVAVAMNQTVYSVIIDPAMTDMDAIEAALKEYAPEQITADFKELKEKRDLRYFVVAKNVTKSAADKIAEKEIAYVWFQGNTKRVYPEGELASGLLGFVNADGIGQYGVEGSLNAKLRGKDGLLKTVADVNKVALSIGGENTKIPAEDGESVVLTVDRGIERGVEEILAGMLETTPATNAAAIVLDPADNKILAMANMPNYNPADYGKVKDASAYLNYTTEVPYEPASVCKNFAFSAAINEGKMTSETTYFNEGYTVVDGWKIQNAEQRGSLYGTITMKTALYWSLNTGSIQALRLLGGDANSINQAGREKLYDYYYNKFRLGKETGIELIEAEGMIPDPNEGYGRDSAYANMTFGQNLSITMIQTITAFSAVVNGGYWRTPYVVAGTMKDGEYVQAAHTESIEEQILTDGTSAMMRDMLQNNRSYKVRGGIDRPGYAVGGKSGTAQVIRDGAYDATMSETVATYIGYGGPSGELPKYVIMVKMWGEGEYMDGTAYTGAAFDSISNFMIDYLKIKPKV